MAIDPVTEFGSGGALRLPHARVVPLSAPPASYTAAVERYLTGAGIAKSSARIYPDLARDMGVDARRRTGADRTRPPRREAARLPRRRDRRPGAAGGLAELAAARADEMDADTVNRELSIARKAIGWWQRQGWIVGDPTIGIERRPAPPDRTKALSENQIAALWRLDVFLREKTCWKMLYYESAARADEVLCLNVEDLYPQDKRGKITAKGGATEWIHWQSGTAQLLPRLIAHRTRGPLFLTDRRAPAGTPTLDVCPETGRARLLPPGRGDLRGEHPTAGQPARLTRGHRGPGRLHPAPAPPQRPHPRHGGRHLHPHAAGPVQARLRPLPGAVRPPGVDAVARHVAGRDAPRLRLGWVRPGRGTGLATSPFPRPARRTRHACLHATGAPRALAGGQSPVLATAGRGVHGVGMLLPR